MNQLLGLKAQYKALTGQDPPSSAPQQVGQESNFRYALSLLRSHKQLTCLPFFRPPQNISGQQEGKESCGSGGGSPCRRRAFQEVGAGRFHLRHSHCKCGDLPVTLLARPVRPSPCPSTCSEQKRRAKAAAKAEAKAAKAPAAAAAATAASAEGDGAAGGVIEHHDEDLTPTQYYDQRLKVSRPPCRLSTRPAGACRHHALILPSRPSPPFSLCIGHWRDEEG